MKPRASIPTTISMPWPAKCARSASITARNPLGSFSSVVMS